MKIRSVISAIFILPFCSTLNAAESPDILPGLWQINMTLSSESGQIEAAMAQAKKMLESMPPEQQKMVKDMMAKQGVNTDFGNTTLTTCITQAQIEDFSLPQNDDSCTQTFTEQSKNHYKTTMNCPSQKMSGEGDFIIKDNKNFEGTIVMQATLQGKQDTLTMKQLGAMMQADCGDYKK